MTKYELEGRTWPGQVVVVLKDNMEDADGIASSIGPVRLSANSQGSRIHLFNMELLLWFPYLL